MFTLISSIELVDGELRPMFVSDEFPTMEAAVELGLEYDTYFEVWDDKHELMVTWKPRPKA